MLVKETTDKLEAGVNDFFDSDRFKDYLRVIVNFHKYSFFNTLLIALQYPFASRVAGYKKWQEFGRQVKEGEKGIKIIAPIIKKTKKEAQELENDSNVIAVEKNNKKKLVGYKFTYVFDVSQTEIVDQEKAVNLNLIDELSDDVDNFKLLFIALKSISPVPIVFEEIKGNAKGYYNPIEKKIVVKEDLSELHTLKTIIHELSHASLHDEDNEVKKNNASMEIEAEGIAYVVCQHLGLDTSDYSFGYVASWAGGKESKALKNCLETIKDTASNIITNVTEQMEHISVNVDINSLLAMNVKENKSLQIN